MLLIIEYMQLVRLFLRKSGRLTERGIFNKIRYASGSSSGGRAQPCQG